MNEAVRLDAVAALQRALLHLGVSVTAADEALAIPDLGTRLLLAQQLEAETGVGLEDLVVLQARTVGDLVDAAVQAARPRPAATPVEPDEGEDEEAAERE